MNPPDMAISVHSRIRELGPIILQITVTPGRGFSGFACDFHFLVADRNCLFLFSSSERLLSAAGL